MPQIKVLKGPGILYDLNFIFYLKFNTKLFVENLSDREKKNENMKYFTELSNQFGEISDDLYVFYHALRTGRCFMFTHYFDTYKDEFITKFDLKFLIDELSDEDKLIRNLIKFYLYDLTDEEIDECVNSSEKLFSYIKNYSYSSDEKTKLYEFFISPKLYISTLKYELMAKEPMINEYYKTNYEKILEAHNNIQFKALQNMMYGLQDLSFLNSEEHELYISYCLLNKYIIQFFGISTGVFYFLGSDYESMLVHAKKKINDFDLVTLGDALGDPSRVKIFKFILNNGEASCKDLEREFEFSGSTAYHHITMMTRSGVLHARNEGKSVYYSINTNYIEKVVDSFNEVLNRLKG